jgi:hypothetical protein
MLAGGGAADPQPETGDTPPSAVRQLIDGLERGDVDFAAATFAADAVYAGPAVEDDETAARAVHEGEAIAAALDADPRLGQPHSIRLCCAEGPDCLLEGWILDESGERSRSFATSLQLDGAGLISRCLLFRAAAVEDEAGPRAGVAGQADIRLLVDDYFEDLHADRFEQAAAHFSADCLYSHPPYSPGTPRAEFRGREELLAGFGRRGPQPVRVQIERSLQRGAELMLEGRTLLDGSAEGPTGSFISCAALGPAGTIDRYVAFHTTPSIARR